MTAKRGRGRPKGSKNRITADINAAWDEAIAIAQTTPGFTLADWATRDEASNEKFWLATTKKFPKQHEHTFDTFEGKSLAELEAIARAAGIEV